MRISTSQIQRNGVNQILDNQSKLNKTQIQLSTGKKINNPSDDPIAATQILRLQRYIGITQQYMDNGKYAEGRLKITDSTLSSITNVIQRVRELGVKGNNVLSDQDRLAISKEVEQRLNEILGLSNTADGNGEYIFSGYSTSTKPFTYDNATNSYLYNGDSGIRNIQIGPTYEVSESVSGDEAFMRIKNGNGTFVTNYNAANTGTGVVTDTRVFDPTAYLNHDYTVTIGAGPTVDVFDNTLGAAVGGFPQPYVSGNAIQFDGAEIIIEGNPAPGDTFTVEPSSSQSLFETVQNLVTALQVPSGIPSQVAQRSSDLQRSLRELDNALNHTVDTRATIGARLNTLESQTEVNDSYKLILETSLSGVEDLDYADAITKMNLQLVGMQAAQQTYTKTQGLSLFNYIN